jgi:hypothetical protein
MNKKHILNLIMLICFTNLIFSQKQVFIDTLTNGTVISFEGCIKKGDTIKNGVYKHFSKKGNIDFTRQYKKNVKQGFAYEYHNDGSVFQKYNISRGKLNGTFEEFYPSGELYEFGKYKKNEKIGKWVKFSESGDTLSFGSYFGESYRIIRNDSLTLIINHNLDTVNTFDSYSGTLVLDELFTTYGVYGGSHINLKKGTWIYKDENHINKEESYNKFGELIEFVPLYEKDPNDSAPPKIPQR